MNSRQIMVAMVMIIALALIGFAYLHSRKAAPLQDASPDATSMVDVLSPRAA